MKNPIISPDKFINYLRKVGRLKHEKPPETIIIIFLEDIFNACKSTYPLLKIDGFDVGDLYELAHESGKVGLFYCKGIGAPAAVINLEELIAFGAKKFIIIGTAGSIHKNIQVGDIVLCNQAIIEEGTSRHYIGDETSAIPHLEWHNEFSSYLSKNGLTFKEGISWTTDAPYRETEEKVINYQKKEVLCVEMEASALFTVANCYKTSIAAAFVISDSIADLTWSPDFYSEKVSQQLLTLIEKAIGFSKLAPV